MLATIITTTILALWALAQWSISMAIGAISHLLRLLLSSSVGVFLFAVDTFAEARHNWHQFFFCDLPGHVALLLSVLAYVFGICSNTVEAGFDLFFTDIPEYILGCYHYMVVEYWLDDTRMFLDWADLTGSLFIFAGLAVLGSAWFKHQLNSTPVVELPWQQEVSVGATTETVAEDKKDVDRPSVGRVSMPAFQRSPTNFTLPKNTPQAETCGLSSDGITGGKKQVWFGRPAGTRESTFLDIEVEERHGGERVFMYGEWRWRQRRTSETSTSREETVTAKPEEPPVPCSSSSEPAEPTPAPQPLAAIPPQVAAPSPPAPLSPQVTVVTPHHGDVPAPSQPLVSSPSFAGVAPPQLSAPVVAPQPSPEEIVVAIFQRYGEHLDVLRNAMAMFLSAVISGSGGYAESGAIISYLMDSAHEDLGPWFQVSVSPLFGEAFPWSQTIMEFWNEVQPRGHFFANHGDKDILALIAKVYSLGSRLGLHLPTPDMSPAPLPVQLTLHEAPAYVSEQQLPTPPVVLQEAPATELEQQHPLSRPADAAQAISQPVQALDATEAIKPISPPAPAVDLPLSLPVDLPAAEPAPTNHTTAVATAAVVSSGGPSPGTSVPALSFGFVPSGPSTSARLPAASRRPATRPGAPRSARKPTPAPQKPVAELEARSRPEAIETEEVEPFDINDLGIWGNLEFSQLVTITKEHFGFANEKRIWTYWGASHLEMNDDDDHCSDALAVQTEFSVVRGAWQRAMWYLVQQSQLESSAGFLQGPPKLLPTITNFLRTAGRMHKKCGGSSGKALAAGLVLFGFIVRIDRAAEARLKTHYGEKVWDEFWQVFQSSKRDFTAAK